MEEKEQRIWPFLTPWNLSTPSVIRVLMQIHQGE